MISAAGAPPPTLDRYEIHDVLGEGAMGVVYRAEQLVPVRRSVALKVLKASANSPDVLQRFETERQSLAMMEHPGIATILDAGATDDGRPYFAMELVDGTPVVEFCDTALSTVEERLSLFVEVCRAVQHAHVKGVIHRDLKPSNILVADVDGRPEPRVIDFGIAKATDSLRQQELSRTRDGQMLGTPAYMSPEQVDASDDIDSRTDVYSLGMVLYELLAGALPFGSGDSTKWAFWATRLTTDPPPPSQRIASEGNAAGSVTEARRTTPAQLQRKLRGDLDWIVTKSLERDRDRRYATPSNLADDLERVLANEPILGRGASTLYRAGKFVRRNRVAVAFAATVFLGTVGVAVTTSVQADRVATARDLAQSRQGQAEDLVSYMVGELADQLEEVGRLDLMDSTMVVVGEYFAAVDESELSDHELFRRAQAVQQIGVVRADQGDWDAAREALHSALAMYRGLADRDPTNSEWQLGLGEGLFYVGFAHRSIGAGDSALAYFEAYRDVAERNAALRPDDPLWEQELASTATNLALQRRTNGDIEGVAAALSDALEAKQSLLRAAPDDPDRKYTVAQGHFNLAVAFEDVGRDAEALVEFERGLQLKRELMDAEPLNAPYVTRLVASLGRTARLTHTMGDAAEALALAREMLELAVSQRERDPENVRWSLEAASARMYLGLLDPDRRSELDEAITSLQALTRTFPEHNQIPISYARALFFRGQLAPTHETAELRNAVAVLDAYLARRPGHAAATENRARSLLELGIRLDAAGRTAEAREVWRDGRSSVTRFEESRSSSMRSLISELDTRLSDF